MVTQHTAAQRETDGHDADGRVGGEDVVHAPEGGVPHSCAEARHRLVGPDVVRAVSTGLVHQDCARLEHDLEGRRGRTADCGRLQPESGAQVRQGEVHRVVPGGLVGCGRTLGPGPQAVRDELDVTRGARLGQVPSAERGELVRVRRDALLDRDRRDTAVGARLDRHGLARRVDVALRTQDVLGVELEAAAVVAGGEAPGLAADGSGGDVERVPRVTRSVVGRGLRVAVPRRVGPARPARLVVQRDRDVDTRGGSRVGDRQHGQAVRIHVTQPVQVVRPEHRLCQRVARIRRRRRQDAVAGVAGLRPGVLRRRVAGDGARRRTRRRHVGDGRRDRRRAAGLRRGDDAPAVDGEVGLGRVDGPAASGEGEVERVASQRLERRAVRAVDEMRDGADRGRCLPLRPRRRRRDVGVPVDDRRDAGVAHPRRLHDREGRQRIRDGRCARRGAGDDDRHQCEGHRRTCGQYGPLELAPTGGHDGGHGSPFSCWNLCVI